MSLTSFMNLFGGKKEEKEPFVSPIAVPSEPVIISKGQMVDEIKAILADPKANEKYHLEVLSIKKQDSTVQPYDPSIDSELRVFFEVTDYHSVYSSAEIENMGEITKMPSLQDKKKLELVRYNFKSTIYKGLTPRPVEIDDSIVIWVNPKFQ